MNSEIAGNMDKVLEELANAKPNLTTVGLAHSCNLTIDEAESMIQEINEDFGQLAEIQMVPMNGGRNRIVVLKGRDAMKKFLDAGGYTVNQSLRNLSKKVVNNEDANHINKSAEKNTYLGIVTSDRKKSKAHWINNPWTITIGGVIVGYLLTLITC